MLFFGNPPGSKISLTYRHAGLETVAALERAGKRGRQADRELLTCVYVWELAGRGPRNGREISSVQPAAQHKQREHPESLIGFTLEGGTRFGSIAPNVDNLHRMNNSNGRKV
ncbi:hypothetical protein R1flu_020594 [Riccia fluitans]|uniref:Uncharacterized protein n=1 Tax=Riccia fluitans TaxID=41844 RepID=A0ABD1ZNK9_9MARC